MMKRHSDVLQDLPELTHLVEDQRCYPNYHQFSYLKMMHLQEDSQEEDTQVEEDSLEEGFLEEAEDIQQEEEAPLEQDPLEEDGDPHQSKYCNHNQENW